MRVHAFGAGVADSGAGAALLGSKGAGLAQMCRLGLPVPPGFTISTEICRDYLAHGQWPAGLEAEVEAALAQLGARSGRRFGDAANPLLVSVRSGAAASMPGMMDTVLDIGLSADIAHGLARRATDARFVWDSYRRFIQMYAAVVMGVDPGLFESLLDEARAEKSVELDTELDSDDLCRLAVRFAQEVRAVAAMPFPQDPRAQLWGAIGAVFASWNTARAKSFRALHGLDDDAGTAVTVQAMVFGNRGETSATGVAFSRDPAGGEKVLYGEYLVNAQGEDVVSGSRTPQPLSRALRERRGGRRASMEEAMPGAYAALADACNRLEAHYRDMQDVEFTVEEGRLYLLQTRTARRTPDAALRIAVAMAREGLITPAEAVARVDPAALDRLLHPQIDPAAPRQRIAAGLGASPGAVTGAAVFTAGQAEEAAVRGQAVILVRPETSAEDIRGMHAANGILTARGGMTSHAAVVARGMGLPCVCGAGALTIDAARGELRVSDLVIARGEVLTIDGDDGAVYLGAVAMRAPEPDEDMRILLQWAVEICGDSRVENVTPAAFVERLVAAQAVINK